ncbi:MAG: BlaI/MecI/CopY family transcriptional regulator [Chloroflexi bacterium]|nr:BlaI/MecI/CopY family transcriptional regulator [Chloroflexota bacterium]MDA8236877.1 BlaI/MecI/CopY family transcriptional regulator [Chloroflexota bacterium]
MAEVLRGGDARQPTIDDVLGPLGAAVMREAWAQGEVSVASVVAALNARPSRPLAYTTVMTILVRLHERGFLTRQRSGRHFLYRPVAGEHDLLELVGRRAVDDILARYGSAALRQFGERLADADPELRDRIIALASQDEG